MRLAILIAKPAGGDHRVLLGPTTADLAIGAFKAALVDPATAVAFESIEVWDSLQGRIKRKRFGGGTAIIPPIQPRPADRPAHNGPALSGDPKEQDPSSAGSAEDGQPGDEDGPTLLPPRRARK